LVAEWAQQDHPEWFGDAEDGEDDELDQDQDEQDDRWGAPGQVSL
jgi:hypothetical protein